MDKSSWIQFVSIIKQDASTETLCLTQQRQVDYLTLRVSRKERRNEGSSEDFFPLTKGLPKEYAQNSRGG